LHICLKARHELLMLHVSVINSMTDS